MARAKPTVYLDTNILSVLHYDGAHIQSIAQRVRTREWWEMERKFFELFSSGRTDKELSSGVYRSQEEAIAEARRLRYLSENGDVKRITEALIVTKLFPENALGDAVQVSVRDQL